jgi:hypothetical protein
MRPKRSCSGFVGRRTGKLVTASRDLRPSSSTLRANKCTGKQEYGASLQPFECRCAVSRHHPQSCRTGNTSSQPEGNHHNPELEKNRHKTPFAIKRTL